MYLYSSLEQIDRYNFRVWPFHRHPYTFQHFSFSFLISCTFTITSLHYACSILLLLTLHISSSIFLHLLTFSSFFSVNIRTSSSASVSYRVSDPMLSHVPKSGYFLDYLNFGALFDFFLWSICWNLCNLSLVKCLLKLSLPNLYKSNIFKWLNYGTKGVDHWVTYPTVNRLLISCSSWHSTKMCLILPPPAPTQQTIHHSTLKTLPPSEFQGICSTLKQQD